MAHQELNSSSSLKEVSGHFLSQCIYIFVGDPILKSMPKIKIVFWGSASFFSVIPQISLRGRAQGFLSGVSEVSLLLGSSLISRFLRPKEVFCILRERKAVLLLITYFPKFVAHILSHFCSPKGYVFGIPMAGRNLIFSAVCHHISSLNKLAWFGGLCRGT